MDNKNFVKVKKELNKGISLLTNRQKVIKLADKLEFGWATVQEYLGEDLADNENDAKKIKIAESSAATRIKNIQYKKWKSNIKSSASASMSLNYGHSRYGGPFFDHNTFILM